MASGGCAGPMAEDVDCGRPSAIHPNRCQAAQTPSALLDIQAIRVGSPPMKIDHIPHMADST